MFSRNVQEPVLNVRHSPPVSLPADPSLRLHSSVCAGVLSVAARGKHLLVAAGSEVFCHDVATGQVVRKFQDLHQGSILCVEGTQDSKMLFTAAGEGLVMAHDLRMKHSSRLIWHHNAGGDSRIPALGRATVQCLSILISIGSL